MSNKICIYHHLGLGDSIECNGMVRHFAESYDQVDIFAKSNYHKMVSYMYRDNPSIKIHEIDGTKEYQEVQKFISSYDGRILIPGHSNYFFKIKEFKERKMGPAEAFYYLAGIDWQFRNKKFFLQRDMKKEEEVIQKLNPNSENYIFIHDDVERGFLINIKTGYKIVKNDISINMFHLIGLLEKAEEIHCMSSSILCLIDCLSTQVDFKKLFLHYNIRKVELGPKSLFGKWEKI